MHLPSDVNVQHELQHCFPINISQTFPERRRRKPGGNRNQEGTYLRTKALSFFCTYFYPWVGGEGRLFCRPFFDKGLVPRRVFCLTQPIQNSANIEMTRSIFIRALVAAVLVYYHLVLNINQPVLVAMRVLLYRLLSSRDVSAAFSCVYVQYIRTDVYVHTRTV